MGGKSDECLLGFDAREMWMAGNRPSEFLLRDDIARALSVDIMVWPSLFRFDESWLPPVVERMPELERPQWIGPNDPFWENLGLLEEAVAPLDHREFPYWLIAASWHTDVGFEREGTEWKKYGSLGPAPYRSVTTPARRDPGWRFLGFDVADPGISGLSNCGYAEDERHGLVQEWSPWLNQHHLFTELEKAFEFRVFSNKRVSEHAPFYVIGLWLVREAVSSA